MGLEESVFNLIIRTVDELKSISAKLDIGLLDDRCLSTAPESQSRQTGKQNRGFRVLEQVQQPRSLEEHEMFCQSHGLGKATRAKSSVSGHEPLSLTQFRKRNKDVVFRRYQPTLLTPLVGRFATTLERAPWPFFWGSALPRLSFKYHNQPSSPISTWADIRPFLCYMAAV